MNIKNFINEPFHNRENRFGFWAPTRIICDYNSRFKIDQILESTKTAILVSDKVFINDNFIISLKGKWNDRIVKTILVEQEPRIEDVKRISLPKNTDIVIAIGGGSTIDFAKALSLLSGGYSPPLNENQDVIIPSIITLPTTCGTGSETSRHAVIYNKRGQKTAIRHWGISPALALLDPYFFRHAPDHVILKTAFDSFIHHLETFSLKFESNALAKFISIYWMSNILVEVEKYMSGGSSVDCISNLQLGSAFGGISISNNRTGLIHTLGENLASQIDIIHPDSLFLFFEPVFKTYHEWFDSQIDMMGMPSLKSTEIINRWNNIWRSLKSSFQEMNSLNINIEELIENACQDIVIFKEHPVKLDVKIITRIVYEALEC